MSRTRLTLLAGVSGMAVLLAGCEEGGLIPKPDGEASSATERPAATQLVERDVEAPEVFKKTENGLWDGRPSLGGVWVAHPDVHDPERVIIRNEVSGKFVIGALFRRERENPGPSLQVSSDAAAALGLVAGQPTRLNVVALRREQEKPALPINSREISDNASPVEADTIAKPEAIAAAPIGSDATSTTAAVAVDADGAATPEVAATEEAPRKRWNPFRRKATETADEGALSPVKNVETVAAPAGSVRSATVSDNAAPAAVAENAAPAAVAENAAPAAVAEDAAPARKQGWTPFRRKVAEPASALRPEATTALTAAGTTVTSQPLTPTPVAAATAAPRKPAAAAGKALVQIGIFSVEANANRAAEIMRKNGVVPRVTKSASQGKSYWRVTVGPASGGSDQSALIRKVKNLGFADAFAVAR